MGGVAQAEVSFYLSPTPVLAFEWEEGSSRPNLLGFAISRTLEFNAPASTWHTNRIGFDGLCHYNLDLSGGKNLIPKFRRWDDGMNTADRRKNFAHPVIRVFGSPQNSTL
jgi:hypothetical protein